MAQQRWTGYLACSGLRSESDGSMTWVVDGVLVYVDDVVAHSARAASEGAPLLSRIEEGPNGSGLYRSERRRPPVDVHGAELLIAVRNASLPRELLRSRHDIWRRKPCRPSACGRRGGHVVGFPQLPARHVEVEVFGLDRGPARNAVEADPDDAGWPAQTPCGGGGWLA